jgi:hypothetical protein
MTDLVAALNAEIAHLKQQIVIYEAHHAACHIGQPQALRPLHGDIQPAALNTGPHTTLELIPFEVSSLSKRKRTAETPSDLFKPKRRFKPGRLCVVEGLEREIDRSSQNQAAELVSFEIPLVTGSDKFEELKARAIETSTLLQKADDASINARVRLFYFLSDVVAFEKSWALTTKEADKLMLLALPKHSVDFRRRVRAGAGWLHENVIAQLVKRGWELDKATAVVARRESHTSYSCPLLTRL